MVIVTTVLICGAHAGLAAGIYVSPSGNDENTGLSSKQPLKSFEKVLERVAGLPKSWPSDLVVHVMPGEYFVESPIRITSMHSSDNGSKLIFRNSGALASAVLIGGKRMNPDKWQEYKPGMSRQLLKLVRSGLSSFLSVFSLRESYTHHSSTRMGPAQLVGVEECCG